MIAHFQFKPLIEQLPGWFISFYYQGVFYEAIYHKNGEIEWKQDPAPEAVKPYIHELMLYHVYD